VDGLILTVEQLKKEVEYFRKQRAFAWDTESMDGSEPETRGVPTQNRIVWISLATYGRTIVIPMGHPNGNVLLQREHTKNKVKYPLVYDEPPEQLRPSVVFEILRPLFFDPDIIKIAHNATFDFISVFKYWGEFPPGTYSDSIVLQWLVDENIGEFTYGFRKRPMNKKLKILTKWYYGMDYDKEEVGKCIEKHSFNQVARYALLDAEYTWLLWLKFDKWCKEQGLDKIRALEEATTRVCCAMGLIGAPVDVEAIKALEKELAAQLVVLESDIFKAAKREFNINSPQQKQDVLYGFKKDGGQGLKPTKLTKGGKKNAQQKLTLTIYDYSTDKESLEEFEDNEVVQALIAYSEVHKLYSTYVIGYLGDGKDKPCRIFNGRIHTDLVQYGTLTGRFSSREPNLQNIPAPSKDPQSLSTKVRGLFKAPPGYKLLVSDYAQMELRVLASMIGHGGLYDGFHAGIDAHTQTAALVYGVSPDDVQKWQRDHAKTLNFAIVYGAQKAKIAKTLGITEEEAQELLDNHRIAFPEVYEFRDSIMKLARSRKDAPFIRTVLGRKRRVWEVLRWVAEEEAPKLPWYKPQNHANAVRSVLARGERQVFNSLVQGSLGDIIKLAMIRLHKLLSEDALKNPGREIHLILSVHDELVLQSPEDRVEEAKVYLLEAMSGKEIQDLIRVPLAMKIESIAVVDKWSDAKG
jgi:DNA polymerase I-like protein with 3'-5' exonuclease and polymerase domains